MCSLASLMESAPSITPGAPAGPSAGVSKGRKGPDRYNDPNCGNLYALGRSKQQPAIKEMR